MKQAYLCVSDELASLKTVWLTAGLPLIPVAVLVKDVHSGKGDIPNRIRRLFA